MFQFGITVKIPDIDFEFVEGTLMQERYAHNNGAYERHYLRAFNNEDVTFGTQMVGLEWLNTCSIETYRGTYYCLFLHTHYFGNTRLSSCALIFILYLMPSNQSLKRFGRIYKQQRIESIKI
ncbi:hypothetical protein M3Y98_00715200 [Aphelenchoides besseyi]|nr:hypothetical protein M3Y98_00715200 [Aphelenchoides besseyi]